MTMSVPEPAGPRPKLDPQPQNEEETAHQGCFRKRPCIIPPCNQAPKARSFMVLKEDQLEPILYASEESAESSSSSSIKEGREETVESKHCVLFPAALLKRIRTAPEEDTPLSSPSMVRQALSPTRTTTKQSYPGENSTIKNAEKDAQDPVTETPTKRFVVVEEPQELQAHELQEMLVLTKSKSSHSSSFKSMEGVEVSKVSSGSFSLSLSTKDLSPSSSSLSPAASGMDPEPLWKRRLSFSRKANSTDAIRPVPRHRHHLCKSELPHVQELQQSQPTQEPQSPNPQKESQTPQPVKITFRQRSTKPSSHSKDKEDTLDTKCPAKNNPGQKGDSEGCEKIEKGGKGVKDGKSRGGKNKKGERIKIRHVFIPPRREWDETSALSIATPASSMGSGSGGENRNNDDDDNDGSILTVPQSWEWMEQWLLLGQCQYFPHPQSSPPQTQSPQPNSGVDGAVPRATRSAPVLLPETHRVQAGTTMRDSMYMMTTCGGGGGGG